MNKNLNWKNVRILRFRKSSRNPNCPPQKQGPPTKKSEKKQALTSFWNDKGGSELFIEPFWHMSGFDLRKIILPNLRWVAIKKCAWSLMILFDQLQVVVSRLSPSNGSWNCRWNYETLTVNNINPPKKMKIQRQISEMDFFILLCIFVSFSLYVHLFEGKIQIHSARYCYGSTIFERHLARIATNILHRPPRLNILLLCTCRCVRNHFLQQLDHSFVAISSGQIWRWPTLTLWRNWSNKLLGIPDRSTRFYVQ